MAGASHYAVDMGWGLILKSLGIMPADVLRQARLPLDLFQREAAALSSAEYFRFWEAIETVAADPLLPIKIVETATPEAFSPVLFACLCSGSLDAALARLAQYKVLVGPMQLTIEKTSSRTVVGIGGLPGDLVPPPSLLVMELAFFTHLARLGLRAQVAPIRVEVPVLPADPRAFADWFGSTPRIGDAARIAFGREDAERPFLTASSAMWAAFEPSLRQRLSDVDQQATMAGRVRGWLNDAIASGRIGVEDAARDLGVSTRTLQRRLSEENTSFQAELGAVREALSRHYLTRTKLSTAEIAFLLGYSEQNSFFRAFHGWTGLSPEQARRVLTSA